MVRAHVWVEGLVQGVRFRQSLQEEALRLGVCGWVRNLPDGRVEAVLEGGQEQVEALLRWCHRGPQAARVTRYEPARGDLAGFRITG
jgi:acylphosphatase